MTKETLDLMLELLAQVRLSPMQQDATHTLDRLVRAKAEIETALKASANLA